MAPACRSSASEGKELGGKGNDDMKTLKEANILVSPGLSTGFRLSASKFCPGTPPVFVFVVIPQARVDLLRRVGNKQKGPFLFTPSPLIGQSEKCVSSLARVAPGRGRSFCFGPKECDPRAMQLGCGPPPPRAPFCDWIFVGGPAKGKCIQCFQPL